MSVELLQHRRVLLGGSLADKARRELRARAVISIGICLHVNRGLDRLSGLQYQPQPPRGLSGVCVVVFFLFCVFFVFSDVGVLEVAQQLHFAEGALGLHKVRESCKRRRTGREREHRQRE